MTYPRVTPEQVDSVGQPLRRTVKSSHGDQVFIANRANVGRGEALDMHKLFDCERLGIEAASNPQSITALDALEVAM